MGNIMTGSRKGRVIQKTAFVGTMLVLLFLSLEPSREFLACRSKLRNVLWNNLRVYQLDHDNHYPQDITTVAVAFFGDRERTNVQMLLKLLSCPGARTHLSLATTNDSMRSDYIYVDWEIYFDRNAVPDDYPVFYDRHLANHWGLGVNVATKSRIFWDFRGHWLRKFSAKHPEYHLPMPE